MELFSDDMRRNPYPAYDQVRSVSPVFHFDAFDLWLIFDYDGVKQALIDHDTFSSDLSFASGQSKPGDWFVFSDPPRHTKLRTLISKAITPRLVAEFEPRVRKLSRQLLDRWTDRDEMDMSADFAVPLPMLVSAELLGIPTIDWPQYQRWSDGILKLANTFARDEEAAKTDQQFGVITAEMRDYLPGLIAQRRNAFQDDLLRRLSEVELDGQRLAAEELLGAVQTLMVGGQETTSNLISNTVLCLMENPAELARLRDQPDLLPSAIEEVLRFRSPVQWMPRATRRAATIHGQVIPAGKTVLMMIGSANRDPKAFPDAGIFDIGRDSNPHLAFGYGIHACVGAGLARLIARVALAEFLERVDRFELARDEPITPRKALHVHGPSQLAIRVMPRRRLMSNA